MSNTSNHYIHSATEAPHTEHREESLDLLLVNANFGRKYLDKVVARMPHLGLLSLAASCLTNGITFELMDTDFKRMSNEDVDEYARSMAPHPRYVGVSATTLTIMQALELCEIFRNRFPRAVIIVGGAHASLLPDEVIASPFVDMVVRGEGEFTLNELIKLNLPLEQIKGLTFKRNGEIVHNPDRELLSDLDSIPMPAYHLLDVNECRPSLGCYKRLPAVPVLTSKGCTNRCSFCGTNLFGRRLRFKSIDRVVQELSYLVEQCNVQEIVFYDDVFTASKSRTFELCAKIIEKGWDISWSCLCRADQVPRDLLARMKEAGCHTISFGVESADEGILTTMNKKTDLKAVEEAVKNCKELEIEQRLAFMFGTPGETMETMSLTFEFAKKLDPMHALFNITTPYPGSEMYADLDRNDGFITKDWRRFDGTESLLKLSTLSKEEVEKFCFHARAYFVNRYEQRG